MDCYAGRVAVGRSKEGKTIRNKDRDNRRRRDKSRIEHGGVETRGRPRSGGMEDRYGGLLTDEQWAFVQAVVEWKANKNIRFLHDSEIYEMITEMGYKKC